jgi:hypothetical protein
MSVLAFPSPSVGQDIPTPIHYQPGDEYDTVLLTSDLAGFIKGCEFYLKYDHLFRGCTHLASFEGALHIGYITNYNPLEFEWASIDPEMPSRIYSWTEAKVIGALTEIWSFGIAEGRPRWVFDEGNTSWGREEHLGQRLSDRFLSASL